MKILNKFSHVEGAKRFSRKLIKSDEHGRSMIEMLGVLAIIGVLSVGGISGYSKAMYKFKINKTIDIFTRVLAEFQEFTSKRLDDGDLELFRWDIYSGSINYGLADYLDSLKDICTDRTYENARRGDLNICPLPIGELGVYFRTYSQNDTYFKSNFRGEFSIDFSGSDKVQACIDFASKDWAHAVPAEWWFPDGYMSIDNDEENYVYYNPNNNKPTYSMADIVSACNGCKDSEYCSFYMVLYGEI